MRLLPNTRNRRRVLRKKLDVLKEPCVNQATKKQVYICLCSSLHFYVEVIVRLHHREFLFQILTLRSKLQQPRQARRLQQVGKFVSGEKTVVHFHFE